MCRPILIGSQHPHRGRTPSPVLGGIGAVGGHRTPSPSATVAAPAPPAPAIVVWDVNQLSPFDRTKGDMVLGKGAFGTVRLFRDRATRTPLAVKNNHPSLGPRSDGPQGGRPSRTKPTSKPSWVRDSSSVMHCHFQYKELASGWGGGGGGGGYSAQMSIRGCATDMGRVFSNFGTFMGSNFAEVYQFWL